MSSFFKKKGGHVNAANVHMTEAEAALAQSDFNIEKITEIQNKFTGGAVLLVPGRIFIREGLLYKVCRKGLKKRQFFLFNDILVYGSVVANRYSHQQILPLGQMSVSSDCFYQPRVDADFISETEQENLDVINAFQISHANKSFHVFGQSAADKANWIANLQKHISRVAKTISDSQQQMLTRPVWVPDAMSRECMICSVKFTPFVRKHHCRRCGRVVCSSCSPHRVSLNAGEGPVTSVDTPQGKLERTCRECFKEMTAVHNRVNSVGSSNSIGRSKYDVDQPQHPSRPPPPAMAAKIVSAAIKTATSSSSVAGGPPHPIDSSTDTEDSDDSGNEQEEEGFPVPAKRSGSTKVDNQPVPAKRSDKSGQDESPTPVRRSPVPAKRSDKSGQDESPTPVRRSSESKSPVPVKRSDKSGQDESPTPESKSPVPAKQSDKSGQDESPTPESKSPVPAKRISVTKSDSSPTPIMKTSNHSVESEEPQPTPPPRKKKLLKQKLREQEESGKLLEPSGGVACKQEESGKLLEPSGGVACKQEESGKLLEPSGGVTCEPGLSPKKPKRRNKYFKPQDEPSEEPGEGESVEGEAVVCVKGGAGDPSDLEGGDPSVHVPEDTTVLDLNTESRPPDSEGGETVKESDGSPDEVGGKRGRRRQKFKPAAS